MSTPESWWEYVPGWIRNDGTAMIQNGTIEPTFVAQFIEEGGEVVRRRVGPFEAFPAEGGE